jgi:hypothetical protein
MGSQASKEDRLASRRCEQCDKEFRAPYELKQHIERVHDVSGF